MHSSGLNREPSARHGSVVSSTVCLCFYGAFLLVCVCVFTEAETPYSAGRLSCLRHVKEKRGGGGIRDITFLSIKL